MNREGLCPEKSQQASGCVDVLTLLLDTDLIGCSFLTPVGCKRTGYRCHVLFSACLYDAYYPFVDIADMSKYMLC